MGIGVPNYTQGKQYPKKNYFSVKDGDNFYRILPPFGPLAEKGVWMVYAASHWLRNEKGQARPIACIQDKEPKTKMVKVRCPICDEVARRKEIFELGKGSLTGEALTAATKMQSDWEFQYGRKSGFYVNAKNREGAIGRLEIKTKHKQALMPVIKELSEAGLDPIGRAGVELNFFRSGTGRETSHTVAAAVEKISAVEQRIKVSPLTEEDEKKMETDAFELVDLFKIIDGAALKRIVDADFNGEVVTTVLNAPKTQDSSTDAGDDDDDADIPSYKPQGFQSTTTPPVPAAAAPAPAPVATAPVAPVQVAPPAPVAVVTQAPAPVQAAPVEQAAAPVVNSPVNKDAFMALFGPKKTA